MNDLILSDWIQRSTEAQGVPEWVEDPDTLLAVARALKPARAAPGETRAAS